MENNISGTHPSEPVQDRVWIEKLALTNFRNYDHVTLNLSCQPVVLTGENGSGKTNLIEAVSLLTAGKGLRGVPYQELTCLRTGQDWVIASELTGYIGRASIGTAIRPSVDASPKSSGRMVRIDGETKKTASVLDRYSHIVWLTPSLDGLLTGAASVRRRFLDHLIIGLDPGFRAIRSAFERAMRQRNKLFEIGSYDTGQFEGLELQMSQNGVALGAARLQAVDHLSQAVKEKWHSHDAVFPWSDLSLDGFIEQDLRLMPALEAEDHYFRGLVDNREKDRAARRSLIGPHRSDLVLTHGPKDMPGHLCSTGEQKALLVGLMLSYVEQVKQLHAGIAPILLIDEVAAHLDNQRRSALFEQIIALKAQVWMTGTDATIFESLKGKAQFFSIDKNTITKS